ncbi:MAG TPA: aminotransferase class V-fold PLP-dependent enzyme [Streptosporangiaceae bacterium]|jgi:selenocysteine lyase/cysteine desulfurase
MSASTIAACPEQQRTPTRPAPLGVVGADLRVPLVTGGRAGYANLDYAASAPALTCVRDAVDAALPWYSSVHRGAGYASRVTTAAYESARASVGRFLGAWRGDSVVFTRHTTDAMNLLAHAAPRDTTVVVFGSEHHATLLPWPAARTVYLAPPPSPEAAVAAADRALRSAPNGPRLLVVTAAGNVTGELWPIAELAETAHRNGARIAVDAAQYVPHHRLDMAALDLDYVALSGHKLYAPYGAGVLAGRTDWLAAAPPYLCGGGATKSVRTDTGKPDVTWARPPERHEAGTPNVLGAIALAAACDALAAADRTALEERERRLVHRLRQGFAAIPEVTELRLWPSDHPRVGIVAFDVAGYDADLVAAYLSAEHGIGVRDGKFCAHPLLRDLLGGDGAAVRASIGAGTTAEHVDRLVAAVHRLVTDGPSWTYGLVDGRLAPVPDPRLP